MKSWKINYETDPEKSKKFLLRNAKSKEDARLVGKDYLHVLMQLGEITEYKITSIEPYD